LRVRAMTGVVYHRTHCSSIYFADILQHLHAGSNQIDTSCEVPGTRTVLDTTCSSSRRRR
jgi:hypothetical protein